MLNKSSQKAWRMQAGFTLIEVLVALMIFAILSGLSYRSLSALIQTRSHVNQETAHWREIMMFFDRVDLDVHQHIARRVQHGKQVLPAWHASPAWVGIDEAQLMFTRLGSPDSTGPLRDSQRIGYRLNKQRIEMLVWPALDLPADEKPAVFTLVNGVKSMQIRYLTEDKSRWVTHWPLNATDQDKSPKAMEMVITLHSGEQLSRVFAL